MLYCSVGHVFIKMSQVDQAQLKGPFLESPGLFGAGKLFYVCLVCQQSFNNSENDKMKLSVSFYT